MSAQEIKKLVPYGYNKIIAQKAGVTNAAVSKFLNGKTNSVKIELAALEVLAELTQKKQSLAQKIK